MLDTQDITLLREMLLEQEGRFLTAMKENGNDIKREFRKELRADIKNSADNLRKEIIHEVSGAIKQSAEDTKRELREEMRFLIGAAEKRIIEGFNNVMELGIIPQLDALHRDVARIKTHLQMA